MLVIRHRPRAGQASRWVHEELTGIAPVTWPPSRVVLRGFTTMFRNVGSFFLGYAHVLKLALPRLIPSRPMYFGVRGRAPRSSLSFRPSPPKPKPK